jgi:uncharacterized protein YqgC (DUF456 family)
MPVLLYALGTLALAAGVAGTVLPALPGSPLLVAGVVLVAWAGDFARVGWPTIVASAVLAGLIVVVDWVAGVLGAKLFGASKWALVGAGVGVVVGLFFGLPGVIFGPAVGAIAFELWMDPNIGRAMKAGLGVFIGFLVGSAIKVALAFTVVGVLIVALLV